MQQENWKFTFDWSQTTSFRKAAQLKRNPRIALEIFEDLKPQQISSCQSFVSRRVSWHKSLRTKSFFVTMEKVIVSLSLFSLQFHFQIRARNFSIINFITACSKSEWKVFNGFESLSSRFGDEDALDKLSRHLHCRLLFIRKKFIKLVTLEEINSSLLSFFSGFHNNLTRNGWWNLNVDFETLLAIFQAIITRECCALVSIDRKNGKTQDGKVPPETFSEWEFFLLGTFFLIARMSTAERDTQKYEINFQSWKQLFRFDYEVNFLLHKRV